MTESPILLNDGTGDAPRPRVYLNLDNLTEPGEGFRGSAIDDPERDARLAADGFEGVQQANDDPPTAGSPLPFCGLDRINGPPMPARWWRGTPRAATNASPCMPAGASIPRNRFCRRLRAVLRFHACISSASGFCFASPF